MSHQPQPDGGHCTRILFLYTPAQPNFSQMASLPNVQPNNQSIALLQKGSLSYINFINRCFGSPFWQLGVPIGSLFHKKLGPYFKAWGSLLVWLTVMYSCGFPQKVRWQNWWIPSVAPMTESVDSLSRSDAEIANKWIPSEGRMTELMDSLSSSDDRIGGCPQQLGCHLVLIWSILDPLTWFLTHFGPLRWILPVETSLSLGPIKTLSQ